MFPGIISTFSKEAIMAAVIWTQPLEVQFTTDVGQSYVIGDVLVDTVELPGACPGGNPVQLQKIRLMDESGQNAKVTVVFLDKLLSLGPRNSAPTISKADGFSILGAVEMAQADYFDFANFKIAFKNNIGMWMRSMQGGTSLWVSMLAASGVTYPVANALKGRFTFTR